MNTMASPEYLKGRGEPSRRILTDGCRQAGRQAGSRQAGRQAEKGAKGGSKGDNGLQVDLQGQGQKGKGTDQL